ncbi:hypothetical protein [Rheinheimera sp. WS51]|uniref:hypothetical protein n=1 Tax=Rheinheimera sp. WS51 TaxID=3425886 RepID=UPI003D919D11
MSVINKMLRDLEQRQDRQTIATQQLRVPYQTGSGFKVLVLILLAVLIATLGYYYLFSPASTKLQAAATKKETAAIIEPVKPDSAAANSELNGQSNNGSMQQHSAEVAKVIEIAASLPQARLTSEQTVSQKIEPQPEQIVKPDIAKVKTAAPVENAINKLAVIRANTEHNLAQQALATEQAGQIRTALLLWQQLAQQQPQQADAYLAQARILQNMGLYDQAHSALILATENGVVNSEIQLLLAQQAIEQQQWQLADRYLPATFLLTEQPEYYGLKATVLQQLGEHRAAEQWFSKLITVQPQQAKWWLGAAISFEALGQQQQAYQHYQQALQWGQQLSAASRQYIQQRLIVTE